jgi:cystathionine beta-lyase/cystathionine gamma-synthase
VTETAEPEPSLDPSTLAARAGLGTPRSAAGADLVAPPSLSSVRTYAGLEELDAAMEKRDGYRRYGNESVVLLEDALARLEAVDPRALPLTRVTASGQAALLLALLLLVTPRRNRVVVVRPCYGGTDALIAGPLGALGTQLTTVDLGPDDADHASPVAAALGDDVAAVVCEVITNPLMSVVDVPAVATAAHAAGAAVVVDSTFTTPFLFRPFQHGADVVFHSLTKHLGGHSDVLGGAVLVAPQHPAGDWVDAYSRLAGCVLGPFDAWLALRGLRTAALRVERGTTTAAALAASLSRHRGVRAVHYPGTHGDADEERAARLLPAGRGPMFSLEIDGGIAEADAFVRRLEGIRLAPSLGDVSTTISHPAMSSHRTLSRERRLALGISDGLIRVSTGVESVADLEHEFAAALGGTM